VKAEPAVEARSRLGESPWWDGRRGELVWVDVEQGRLHRGDPDTGRFTSRDVGGVLPTVLPRRDGGLVLALRDTLVTTSTGELGTGETSERLARLSDLPEDLRFNDGGCDPIGRLWIGTMSVSRRPDAALYRLEGDGALVPVVRGLTVSNGIDWSPDGATLYHVDTPTARIDAYDYDVADASIGGSRCFVELPGRRPDGLTVDAEGGIWVALFGTGEVHRYAPDGSRTEVVEIPTPQTTSCAFGGDGFDRLFVTTANVGDGATAGDDGGAGAIFVCTPGVTGRPVLAFAG
jgi:sugar lactone lactonase YvrE